MSWGRNLQSAHVKLQLQYFHLTSSALGSKTADQAFKPPAGWFHHYPASSKSVRNENMMSSAVRHQGTIPCQAAGSTPPAVTCATFHTNDAHSPTAVPSIPFTFPHTLNFCSFFFFILFQIHLLFNVYECLVYTYICTMCMPGMLKCQKTALDLQGLSYRSLLNS